MTQESVLFPGREAAKEKFVWRATYEDKTIINNVEAETYVKTEDLPRDGLRFFEIVEGHNPLLRVQILPDDRFAFRKRTIVKAGEGMIGRYYIIRINRGDTFDHYYLDEESKTVSIVRLRSGEDMSGWMYAFSPAENDDTIVT